MSYAKMLLAWLIIISSIGAWFLFGQVQHFFPGTTRIGTFKTFGTEHEVYDVKAGNRACLMVATKFERDPNPRFFFSCPQER